VADRPIRVIHIITRMILGGAQENTLLTCRGLHESGRYEVSLVTGPAIGPEGELLSQAERSGFEVVVVPQMRREIHPLRDLASLRALRRIIAERRPQIVHTHSSKAGILGRYAAHREGVPIIVHTIHGLPFHPYERWWLNRLYVWLERRAAGWSSQLVSVADAMTEQAVAAGVAEREKFVTIYSGMEVEAFLGSGARREEMRQRFGFGPGDFVFGKVARLFELKGHEYVLRAAQRLCGRHPELRLLFVGDGVLRGELERLADDLGLAEKVVFAGLVPASMVPACLAAMDALVHASLREGLARVLPQALLAGKPAVSFNVDGAREVVVDGQTGYLVAPRSVGELAEAMGKVIERRKEAERMAARGRELCRERFEWRAMVERLDRLYRRLLDRARAVGI